jgi:hypothetical protein
MCLGSLKISGSSVGVYHQYLYGSQKDPDLVFGYPQPVRGDEWDTVTPIVLSQAKNNFTIQNPSIGNGEDTSVLLSVPYKNWLIILKPWNIWYLFLPLATAFALQWWTLVFLLCVAVYLLVLKLFPRKYLLATLFSLFIALSPFIQWWYRDYLIATVAFSLFALLLGIKLSERGPPPRRKALYAIGMGYCLAVFVLIEYPPFQIMSIFAGLTFYLCYLYQKGLFGRQKRPQLGHLIYWLLASICAALVPLSVYYEQHKGAIQAVANTTFPGNRLSESGQAGLANFVHLLTGPFSAELQRHTNAAVTYYGNQSEASLFIQYSVFLCLPLLYVVIQQYRKHRKIKWDFVLLLVGILLIYLYMFVPGLTAFYGLLLFNRIPLNRFELGIGLLDFFGLLLIVKHTLKESIPTRPAAIMSTITFIGFFLAGVYTRHHYPGYLGRPLLIIGASAWMAIALYLLLTRKQIIGLTLLVLLSIVSVYRVNPLYRGLSPLNDTPLATTIQHIVQSNPNKQWLATDFILQDYPEANGAKSLTGDYSYPQTKIWKQVDSNPQDLYIYNRSAHVLATISNKNSLSLVATDLVHFNINPCSQLVNKLNIGYLLTITAQANRCLVLKNRISFPARTAYIYTFKSS